MWAMSHKNLLPQSHESLCTLNLIFLINPTDETQKWEQRKESVMKTDQTACCVPHVCRDHAQN